MTAVVIPETSTENANGDRTVVTDFNRDQMTDSGRIFFCDQVQKELLTGRNNLNFYGGFFKNFY